MDGDGWHDGETSFFRCAAWRTPAEHIAELAGLEPAAIECARARKARTHGTYTRRIIWQPAAGLAAPRPMEAP